MTKEKSVKLCKEELKFDSAVLAESPRSVISKIDGSDIEASILEKKVTSLMDSAEVTGLAIAILNENQIVFRKAFGYANQKKKTLLQINHSFSGASLSKAVFG
ncbi:MAG: beta-lactamase family protein, partial [Saprospiraceae bacterium]|nr:beta-lactamase family protein [Saprospiraceae bacterium]